MEQWLDTKGAIQSIKFNKSSTRGAVNCRHIEIELAIQSVFTCAIILQCSIHLKQIKMRINIKLHLIVRIILC